MFLETLELSNKNGVIRHVKFRKGLNLIIDETTSANNSRSSGNNVGKTSVLRLVYFCLGGDGKNLYQDPEFKGRENTTVKNFLIDTEVCISLSLVDSLEFTKKRVEIQRNFLQRKKKILSVNGKRVAAKELDALLRQELLGSTFDKPTFKDVISKNIRDEKNKISNLLRILHPYATAEQYEALFLFLLGIETDSHKEKQNLAKKKKQEDAYQKRLKEEGELSFTEQQLALTNSKIDDLKKQKLQFNFDEHFEAKIARLEDVKRELSELSSDLSSVTMKRDLILESQTELESEKSNIDEKQIELLYKKAKKLIPSLQKSFKETLDFHNHLIDEKIAYISQSLPHLEKKLTVCQDKIEKLRAEEKSLSEYIGTSHYNEKYEKILRELNQLFEKKGRAEELKSHWINSNARLKDINEKLDRINKEIESKDRLIQERITVFNAFFSQISNRLYGEEYLLSSQKDTKGYDLIVTNLEGNPSPGKKKGQIAAFDFSYIQFAEKMGINCMHFLMHDQLENMHGNQMSEILIDIANSVNCQFVLPIIRDKIPNKLDIEEYVVLCLSENDKLFKI